MILMKDIIKNDNPLLRQKSAEVTFPLSEETIQIIESMIKFVRLSQNKFYAEIHNIRPSLGLSAIQIGVPLRIIVIRLDMFDPVVEYVLINPVVKRASKQRVAIAGGEGCLSVEKDVHGRVVRHQKIEIEAYDYLAKKKTTINASDVLSIVIQHELDHLEGIIYYDHFSETSKYKNVTLI